MKLPDGVIAFLLIGAAACSAGQATKPARVENSTPSKYLLLDARIVESATNARLVLGTVRKEPGNPLLTEEKSWEPRFDNLYANVLYDEDEHTYKCWYSPFIIDEAVTRTPPEKRKTLSYMDALHGNDRYMGVCYATSKDGVTWTRPDLGIVELDGSKSNNIVLRGVHGAGIFKDSRDPDPRRRYKLFAKTGEDREPTGVAFSPDGLHWSASIPSPQMQAAGDTHNNAYWDSDLESYVAITRLSDGRQRTVGRSVSKDFVHWTRAVEVLHGTPERQTYAMPVFRYANLYLALVMILDTKTDMTDCELAWSPDGIHWSRVCEGTALIPRGPKGSFDHGCVYAAAYPVISDKEIRLYYGGSDDTHGSWRKGGFGLARLRPDGFAGFAPVDKHLAAEILTRPIRCAAEGLRVSADAEGGSLQVEVLDSAGTLLGTSHPLKANVSNELIKWDRPQLLAGLRGKSLRLRFKLSAACLYSFGFTDI